MSADTFLCFFQEQRKRAGAVFRFPLLLLPAIVLCLITSINPTAAIENDEPEPDGFVLAGSVDNQFSITVTNPGSDTSLENLTLSVANETQWIANIRIEADNEGSLPPKTSRQYTVYFDVRENAVAGTIETVTFHVAMDEGYIDDPDPEMIVEITEPQVSICLAGAGTQEEPGYLACEEKKPIYSLDDIWVLYKPSPGFGRTFQWQILRPDGTSFRGIHMPGTSPQEDADKYDIRRDENGDPQQMTIRLMSPDPGKHVVQMRTEFPHGTNLFGQGSEEEGEWQDEGSFDITPATVSFQGFVAQQEATFGNVADKAKLTITASATAEGTVNVDLLGTWQRRECATSTDVKPAIIMEKAQSKLVIDFPESMDLDYYLSSPDADDPPPAENPEYADAERIKISMVSPLRGKHRIGMCATESNNELHEAVFNLEFAGLVPTVLESPELWNFMADAWELSNSPAEGDFLWENPSSPDQNQRPQNRSLNGPLFDGTLLFGADLINAEQIIGNPSRTAADHLRAGDTKWYMPVRIHMTLQGSGQTFGPFIKGFAVYGAAAGGEAGDGPPNEDHTNKPKIYKIVKIEGPENYTSDNGDKTRVYEEGSLGFSSRDELNPDGVLLSDNVGFVQSFRFSQTPQTITDGEPFIINLDAQIHNMYLPEYFEWTGEYHHKNIDLDFNMNREEYIERIFKVFASSGLPAQQTNSVTLSLNFTPVPSETINASSTSYLAEITSSGSIMDDGGETNKLFRIGRLPDPPHLKGGTKYGALDIYYVQDEDGSLIAATAIPYEHPDLPGSPDGVDDGSNDSDDTISGDDDSGSGTETAQPGGTGGGTGTITSVVETEGRPVDPNTIDPNSENVAKYIREWIAVAEPPQNAVPGSNWRYDKFGRTVGSGPGLQTIQSRTHDTVEYGSGTPEETVWSIRQKLDSINHCTLEEYVVATLNGEYISHCIGRYGAVRDLKGLKLNVAKAAVEDSGFSYTLAPGSPAKTQEEDGSVEKQEPPPVHYLKKGDTVKLYVHSPFVPQAPTLPDFIEKPLREAKEWIQENKLSMQLKPGSPAPSQNLSGAVQKQNPEPGTKLGAGGAVTLTVYSNFVNVRTVPYVLHLSLKDARNQLENAGLTLAWQDGGRAPNQELAGTAKQQEPLPGTETASGQGVRVWFYGQYTPSREELVSGYDCTGIPGSRAYWDNNANAPLCGCFDGLQLNLSRTRCITQNVADNELCARDYPGSFATGRASNGSINCDCPAGLAWNPNRTMCVTKRLTDYELCARDYPGSIANGRQANGSINCECPQGLVWNPNGTQCVQQVVQQNNDQDKQEKCDKKIWEISMFMKVYNYDRQNNTLQKQLADNAVREAGNLGCDQAKINQALGTGGGTGTGTGTSTYSGDECSCVDENGRWYRVTFGQDCGMEGADALFQRDYNCAPPSGGNNNTINNQRRTPGSCNDPGMTVIHKLIDPPPYAGVSQICRDSSGGLWFQTPSGVISITTIRKGSQNRNTGCFDSSEIQTRERTYGGRLCGP